MRVGFNEIINLLLFVKFKIYLYKYIFEKILAKILRNNIFIFKKI